MNQNSSFLHWADSLSIIFNSGQIVFFSLLDQILPPFKLSYHIHVIINKRRILLKAVLVVKISINKDLSYLIARVAKHISWLDLISYFNSWGRIFIWLNFSVVSIRCLGKIVLVDWFPSEYKVTLFFPALLYASLAALQVALIEFPVGNRGLCC